MSRNTFMQTLSELLDSDSEYDMPQIPRTLQIMEFVSDRLDEVIQIMQNEQTPLSNEKIIILTDEMVQESEDKECIICMGQDNKQYCLIDACGHLFHVDCLQQWYNQKRQCPVCRTNF